MMVMVVMGEIILDFVSVYSSVWWWWSKSRYIVRYFLDLLVKFFGFPGDFFGFSVICLDFWVNYFCVGLLKCVVVVE